MTTVTIARRGPTYRLTALGHATGSSEVCAAVSALVYALGGCLKNLERTGAVSLGTFRLASGGAELESTGEASRYPYAMAAVGLAQLAARYPAQVRVDAENFF